MPNNETGISPSIEIAQLIEQIRNKPNDVLLRDGDCSALEQLAAIGAPDVRPILDAMSVRPPKGQDPRDVAEALAAVLYEIAKRNPEPLLGIVESATDSPPPFFVLHALEYVGKEHRPRVIDVLLPLLRHKDVWTRKTAVSVLAKMGSKSVIEPLLSALSDRSTDVKFAVVLALNSNAILRDARALEPLTRIVQNQSLKKNHPGICSEATKVIKKIESK